MKISVKEYIYNLDNFDWVKEWGFNFKSVLQFLKSLATTDKIITLYSDLDITYWIFMLPALQSSPNYVFYLIYVPYIAWTFLCLKFSMFMGEYIYTFHIFPAVVACLYYNDIYSLQFSEATFFLFTFLFSRRILFFWRWLVVMLLNI